MITKLVPPPYHTYYLPVLLRLASPLTCSEWTISMDSTAVDVDVSKGLFATGFTSSGEASVHVVASTIEPSALPAISASALPITVWRSKGRSKQYTSSSTALQPPSPPQPSTAASQQTQPAPPPSQPSTAASQQTQPDLPSPEASACPPQEPPANR